MIFHGYVSHNQMVNNPILGTAALSLSGDGFRWHLADESWAAASGDLRCEKRAAWRWSIWVCLKMLCTPKANG